MACSKIFSGLPDLLDNIIQYFRDDFTTLNSCSLVNILWCRLAIPLLWENPFLISTHRRSFELPINHKYQFIKIYLHNLNDGDKSKLIRYGIDSFPSNTMFNYPSFVKRLNTDEVFDSIEVWVSMRSGCGESFIPNSISLILESLSKIFIKSKANIHTFEVDIPKYFMFGNISTKLFEKFSRIIIDSQQNLRKLALDDSSSSLSLLKNLKNSNCPNTLKIIIFHKIDFVNVDILNEAFERLNVLESVHIIYCPSFSNFIQQIIDIT